MRFPIVVSLLAALAMHTTQAQGADSLAKMSHVAPPDTAPRVRFGAFVDSYYAWDNNQPRNFDRPYTTQPARHAEFNINLAYVEAKLAAPRYRGRLALQYGTSVQANYAGEPKIGGISGPSVSQYLQEATVGYRLHPTLWVDGGIFFAHTGYEGWISRDNLTYSRSLIADFSPYYEAGVKFTWTPSPSVTAQLNVVNGWQTISNYNTPPAVGVRVDWVATPALTVSYDNFVGNVAPDSAPGQIRAYHEVIAQYNPSARWQLAVAADLGTQSRSTPTGGTAVWYGASAIAKYHVSSVVAIVGRLENFDDPDRAIVVTTLPDPFQAVSASIGLDVTPVSRVQWRTEFRGFRSAHPVWPESRAGRLSRNDSFAVTSLSLSF